MAKPWILMYVRKVPYPLDHGTSQRIWQMVQYLRHEYRVGMVIPKYVPHVTDLSRGMDGVWVGENWRIFWRIRKRLGWRLARFLLERRYRKHLQEFAANPLAYVHPVSALLLDRLCGQLKPIVVI